MKLAAELEVLIPTDKITARVKEIGAQIERDYQGKDLVLLGVLKGSYIFISDLARAIDLPLAGDFIGLSSYAQAPQSRGRVKNPCGLSKPIQGHAPGRREDIRCTRPATPNPLHNPPP